MRDTWAQFYPNTRRRIVQAFRIDPSEPLPFYVDKTPPNGWDMIADVEYQLQRCADCRGLHECTASDAGFDIGWLSVPLPKMNRAKVWPGGHRTEASVTLHWHAAPCRYARQSAASAADESGATASRIKPLYRSATLSNFEQVPGSEAAVRISEEYIGGKLWTDGKCLILIGPGGTGKTHLASAIANAARANFATLFVSSPELFGQGRRQVQTKVDISGNKTQEFFDKWGDGVFSLAVDADLLVIDDVGTETMAEGDWAYGRMNLLIDQRYQSMRGTVITSNLSMIELTARFGRRATDRLSEKGRAVLLECDDYRNRPYQGQK